MRPESLEFLRSPAARSRLRIKSVACEQQGEIKTGELIDEETGATFPIDNFIPRFVPDDTYAASFGEQWNRYRLTQLDRFNGTTLSRDRLFQGTGWTPAELSGQTVLEVGCGAGRFTQVLLDAGANLCSLDYSSAVEACWSNNAPHERLTLVQADLYKIPYRQDYFDKVFCYGVLQHTPDVKRSFMSLIPHLRSGGKLAVDLYRKSPWITRWTAKYWYRPITTRMSRDLLRRLVEWYVPRWIPIDNALQRVRVLRYAVPAIVPCWNYTGMLPLTSEQIKNWAILDTFDALSPKYDFPQTEVTLRAWCAEAGLEDIQIEAAGNGLICNARKP
ncbi:MAG TPA: methyltransferase domain-containing protein [Pyrinomonadaceae bacterium]|nr:methyltransferase domain-containing protein [Pyrinomonadaceae bacterium]